MVMAVHGSGRILVLDHPEQNEQKIANVFRPDPPLHVKVFVANVASMSPW
jgi:hypothetical protein